MNGAWHAGDDRVGEYDSETAALEAVQSFVTKGQIPADMRPVEEDGPEQVGPG